MQCSPWMTLYDCKLVGFFSPVEFLPITFPTTFNRRKIKNKIKNCKMTAHSIFKNSSMQMTVVATSGCCRLVCRPIAPCRSHNTLTNHRAPFLSDSFLHSDLCIKVLLLVCCLFYFYFYFFYTLLSSLPHGCGYRMLMRTVMARGCRVSSVLSQSLLRCAC